MIKLFFRWSDHLIEMNKEANLENFFPRRKRTGPYEIFSFGSDFALYKEPTQLAAVYSAKQNKPNLYDLFMLNANARGELVDDPTRADLAFWISEEDVVTPLQVETLLGKFM